MLWDAQIKCPYNSIITAAAAVVVATNSCVPTTTSMLGQLTHYHLPEFHKLPYHLTNNWVIFVLFYHIHSFICSFNLCYKHLQTFYTHLNLQTSVDHWKKLKLSQEIHLFVSFNFHSIQKKYSLQNYLYFKTDFFLTGLMLIILKIIYSSPSSQN